MLAGNLTGLLSENSTNVHTEITLKAFKLRAAALRVPFFNRADRLANLFCTPLPGTRARAKGADISPMLLGTIEVDDIRYSVQSIGNPSQRPYLLCAHGWSSFGGRFAPWAKAALGAGFALLSFDSQAHGDSDGKLATFPTFIDSIQAMRQHFGEPAAAVGHSFGAAALAVSAAEHGLRCPLVMIAPPADLLVAMQGFVRRVGLPSTDAEPLAQTLSARIGRDAKDFRATKFASRIRNPVLIVHDQEDREVSWNAGAQYAMLINNARIITTTGLGHHRILTDAETIRAALSHVYGGVEGERLLASGLDLQF